MPYFEKAIEPIKDGVIINIHAIPTAKITRILYYDPFRKLIEIEVSHGGTNKKLIEYFARNLNVPIDDVSIVEGVTIRKKSIKIKGITKNQVVNRIERLFR
ncbi:MAG: DUF167 domain-containing protein [Methanosarcinales archaeon]